MYALIRGAMVAMALAWLCSVGHAQMKSASPDWPAVLSMPAVSGHEQLLVEEIRKRLKELSPTTDNLGNLSGGTVGSARRTPLDR